MNLIFVKKDMKKSLLLALAFILSTTIFSQGSYEILVATDFDGKVTTGSIENLIAEIRKGKPVRVGWQLDFDGDKNSDFDHWVNADFITILGGHVFTQIETIFIQGPNPKIPQVEIYPSTSQWTALIGTNGKLLNRFIMDDPPPIYDEKGNEIDNTKMKERFAERRKVDTWKVATFWSVMN